MDDFDLPAGLGPYDGLTVETWLIRLSDHDSRREAEQALGRFIREDPTLVRVLLKVFRCSDNIKIVGGIICAFAEAGDRSKDAVPDLFEMLFSGCVGSFSIYAHHAIRSIGLATLPFLEEQMRSDHHKRRMLSAGLIGILEDVPKPTLDALYYLLCDSNSQVRTAAAETLTDLENRYIVAPQDEPTDERVGKYVKRSIDLFRQGTTTAVETYSQVYDFLTPNNIGFVMSLLPEEVLRCFRESAMELPRTTEDRSKLAYINGKPLPDETLVALIRHFELEPESR